MVAFLGALALFVAAHLVPAAPPVRRRLTQSLGRTAYLWLYSITSLALLALVVVTALGAETVWLWSPAPWHGALATALMPAAFIFIVAGLAEPNPLSVSIRPGTGAGPLAAVTRHPVLWGFLIWALAHVPPNGRLVPVILFGTMAAMAAAGMAMLDARHRRRLGVAQWQDLARATSLMPFVALAQGRARLHVTPAFAAAIAAGLALFAWMLLDGHERLIGRDPLGWTGAA